MKISRGWLVAGLAMAVAVPLAVVLGVVISFGRSDRICRGVSVSGVELGGLSRAMAENRVRAWSRERMDQRIVLTALDSRWGGLLSDFGARVEWQSAVDKAFAVGREGSVARRALDVLSSGGDGKRITAEIRLDRSRLEKTISKAASAVNRPHRDARVKVVDGRLQVEQDVCGIELSQKRAVEAVYRGVLSGRTLIALPIEPDLPNISAKEASSIDTLLARFTTSFNAGKRERTGNLTLAAKEISGLILKPGAKFSYNDVVGPRVAERGYRNAQIFVRGKLEPGLGGGICQVSSTLYNAVLLAGLKIRERHPHSRTVPYVAPGRDATVAYGLRDFRFENSNDSPICLISSVSGSRLTVDIYGAADDRRDISIFTSRPAYTAAGSKTFVDPSMKPGTRRQVEEGARGVSVTVYRKMKKPDGKQVVEVVSKDRYPAQAAVIAVGGGGHAEQVKATPAVASARQASEVHTD